MELENTLLSEISWTQNTLHTISSLYTEVKQDS